MTWKGVFFDLYGTLLISADMPGAWDAWRTALYDFFVEHGLILSEAEFAPLRDGLFDRPVPAVQEDGLTLYERQLQALGKDLGLRLTKQELSAAAATSIEAWQQSIDLDPEAFPTLGALKQDHKLALISNFDHPPHAHALLADLGLLPFFDAVVISGDVGVKKPDPRIFYFALRKTGLRPEEVLFVGDSPEDVEGARAAGLSPVHIRRQASSVWPHYSPEATIPTNGGHRTTSHYPFVGVPTISGLRELLDILN